MIRPLDEDSIALHSVPGDIYARSRRPFSDKGRNRSMNSNSAHLERLPPGLFGPTSDEDSNREYYARVRDLTAVGIWASVPRMGCVVG